MAYVVKFLLLFELILLLLSFSSGNFRPDCDEIINDRTVIVENLNDWSSRQLVLSLEAIEAEWELSNNNSPENQRIRFEKSAALADFRKKIWRVVSCFDCAGVCSETEARRLDTYRNIGTSVLPTPAFKEFTYVQTTMQNIYTMANVCRPNGYSCLSFEPELASIMSDSNDYCELLWAWRSWRDATGRLIRPYYIYYVHMMNEASVLHGMKDAKQMWTKPFTSDDPDFFQQLERAWQTVRPFYEHLHAYVRRKLIGRYGADKFPTTRHIPAHLLGNMWAHDWSSLYPLLRPDKNSEPVDVTYLLNRNGYDVKKMVELADELFMSIGMEPLTDIFWEKSIFTKPVQPVQMDCHASAWDFLRKDDFRIKMCAKVDHANFMTVHHEAGHIQYFQHYQNQPVEFREGANPGFHEAIGDLVALSVMTPVHLKAINLLPRNFPENDGMYLNALMKSALEKIAFLPFGYLLDKYRWLVFEKKISVENLNSAYWQMRCDIQGVSPPIQRTEEDFDAGAKFQIPGSVPYIKYFYSQILQYQIHVSLCKEMGMKKDFHKCDIYRNLTAARRLKEAMKLGASKPYPQILQILTGTAELDATPLMEYYEPLIKWLAHQNRGYAIGWQGDCLTSIRQNKCNIGGKINDATFVPRPWLLFLLPVVVFTEYLF